MPSIVLSMDFMNAFAYAADAFEQDTAKLADALDRAAIVLRGEEPTEKALVVALLRDIPGHPDPIYKDKLVGVFGGEVTALVNRAFDGQG